MERIAYWFTHNRLFVLTLIILLTAVSTYGFLEPSRTAHPIEKYRDSEQDSEVDFASRVSNRLDLARSDAFLVIDGENLFNPKSMAAIRRMVSEIDSLPTIDNLLWVDEIPQLNVFGFVDPLIPDSQASQVAFDASLQRVREHALARHLVSEDGQAMMMPIVYDWLMLEGDTREQLVDQVLQVARQAIAEDGTEEDPVIRVRLTGSVPLFEAQEDAFGRNQVLFQAVGYTLGFVLAAFMLRGVAALLVVSTGPALAVFWSLGCVKLLGLPSNPLAEVVMPVMVSMIALTDGIHLLVHIRRERLMGASPVEAASSGIAKVGLACWLTSLTTAIGFAALMTASSEYVQDFGKICCAGVLIAFLAVILFVPLACSSWIGRFIQQGEETNLMHAPTVGLQRLIDLSLKYRFMVALGSVLVTLVLAAITTSLKPDNRIASGMPSSSEAYEALAFCDENFGGIQFFQIRLNWNEEISSEDPRILAAIRDAEALVESEPLLSYPLSARSMLASFPGDPKDLETQMAFLSLLPRGLRDFFFDSVERQAVISVRIQDRGIAVYKPVFDRLDSELLKLEGQYDFIEAELLGNPVSISRDLYQIVRDLQVSLLTASGIILLVLTVIYRSIRIGLISVVPNLFPLVVTGTWLACSEGTLNLSAVCAFVVCLGIAVDDTIHFLSRFFQEAHEQPDVQQAIHEAFLKVGSALLMTTIILVTGFGTMLLSDLPGHRTFASMACLTIAAAILGDVLALPALLSYFSPKTPATPETD